MEIRYLGHASFLLTTKKGLRIVTDPYPESIYPHEAVECDIVTQSHSHFDHCDMSKILGEPVVVTDTGLHEFDGLNIIGIPSYHDNARGAKRGTNTIYLFEEGNFCVAHLGDLGHLLSVEDINALGGKLDVLMIPVGGFYTIEPNFAVEICKELAPKRIIPMHYACEGHSMNETIAPLETFLELTKEAGLRNVKPLPPPALN
ncbi:MAG: MBL fold metallo-hydrolase [Clostridia bacterium]|nr:MBL fold metallo-hydrolase [Clostridia bacterium]